MREPGRFIDPAALPMPDRLKLLRNRMKARRAPRGDRSISQEQLGLQVLSTCTAAGVGAAVGSVVLDLVSRSRVSPHPDSLPAFLEAYCRLAATYGEPVVLEWLRKAPSIIRAEAEVPMRLAQLQQLLGGAESGTVLALTKRCPQVLGVEHQLAAARLQLLCDMLGRDQRFEGPEMLAAAPALLAMQPDTLAAKLARLRGLAASHPAWRASLAACRPRSLAVLLTYSLERQVRLRYLAAAGLQARASMSTVMAWSKKKMLEVYPEFADWTEKQQRNADAAPLPAAELEAAAAVAAAAAGEAVEQQPQQRLSQQVLLQQQPQQPQQQLGRLVDFTPASAAA